MAILTLGSCSKENDPVIDITDPAEVFLPAPDATDEISEIRRQFFKETGSYLLFNDTLQHKFIGQDANGEALYFTEVLDIKYEVGQTGTPPSFPYTFTYLNTEKCKSALEYMKQFIFPHFSEELRPYSWLLVGNINGKDNNNKVIHPYAAAGQRGIILACAQLDNLKTDAQKQQLANRHLVIIVQNLANKNANTFSEFTAVNSNDYSQYYSVAEGKTTLETVREKGFLGATNNYGTYPTQSEDISAYSSLIVSYSTDQIEKAYANYPLIIKKVRLFKEALEKLGYIF